MDSEYDYTKILKQLVFSYFINAIVFIITPLGTMLLSRSLSVADFGVYALFLSWWNVGMHFGSFGFNTFIQNYFPGRALSEQQNIAGGLFQFVFFTMICFGFLFFFYIGEQVMAWLNLSHYFRTSLIVVGAIMISGIAIIPHAWLSALEKLNLANVLYGINATVWIVLSAVEVLLTGSLALWHVVLYWVVGAFLQFVISLVKLSSSAGSLLKSVISFPKYSFVKKGLFFGVPLLPVAASQWVMTSVDRALLVYLVGQESVGLYSLVYSLVGIVASFSTMVITIFYTYIAKAWNTKNYVKCDLLWNAALKYVLLIVLPGFIGVMVLRKELILVLGGIKFVSSAFLVPYLAFFPLVLSVILMLQLALLVRGKSFFVGLVYLFGFVLNAVLTRVSVPFFGITGAAVSTVASYFFIAIIFFVALRNEIRLNLHFVKVGKIIGASFVMGVVLLFSTPTGLFATLAVVLFGAVVYFFMLLVLKVFGKDEWSVLKSLFSRRGDHNI